MEKYTKTYTMNRAEAARVLDVAEGTINTMIARGLLSSAILNEKIRVCHKSVEHRKLIRDEDRAWCRYWRGKGPKPQTQTQGET